MRRGLGPRSRRRDAAVLQLNTGKSRKRFSKTALRFLQKRWMPRGCHEWRLPFPLAPCPTTAHCSAAPLYRASALYFLLSTPLLTRAACRSGDAGIIHGAGRSWTALEMNDASFRARAARFQEGRVSLFAFPHDTRPFAPAPRVFMKVECPSSHSPAAPRGARESSSPAGNSAKTPARSPPASRSASSTAPRCSPCLPQ